MKHSDFRGVTPSSERQEQRPDEPREAYQSPRLTLFGDVASLTLNLNAGGPDGLAGSQQGG